MKPIRFIVIGKPVPKQSFRYSKHGNHQPQRVTDWQNAVAWEARIAMSGNDPITGPVAMRCVFVLPNNRRVDIDNLNKAILDACNGIVFKDDHQVMNLHLIKRVRETPGVYVEVYPGELLPLMEKLSCPEFVVT